MSSWRVLDGLARGATGIVNEAAQLVGAVGQNVASSVRTIAHEQRVSQGTATLPRDPAGGGAPLPRAYTPQDHTADASRPDSPPSPMFDSDYELLDFPEEDAVRLAETMRSMRALAAAHQPAPSAWSWRAAFAWASPPAPVTDADTRAALIDRAIHTPADAELLQVLMCALPPAKAAPVAPSPSPPASTPLPTPAAAAEVLRAVAQGRAIDRRMFELLAQTESEHTAVLLRDMPRTFPSHRFFDEGSVGRTSLTRVLNAYAVLDPEVGYVQGMNFVTAVLLTLLHGAAPSGGGAESGSASDTAPGSAERRGGGEAGTCDEDARLEAELAALDLLRRLMSAPHLHLRQLYCSGMPLLQLCFQQWAYLLDSHLPQLSAHFNAVGLSAPMYVAEWCITLFTYCLPLPMAQRFLAMVAIDGWPAVFRLGLALLQDSQEALMCGGLEVALDHLKGHQRQRDVTTVEQDWELLPREDLLGASLQFSISQALLDAIAGAPSAPPRMPRSQRSAAGAAIGQSPTDPPADPLERGSDGPDEDGEGANHRRLPRSIDASRIG